MRLTIFLGWWNGWQPVYEAIHVNALCRMLRKHLHMPFRIILLTDQDASGVTEVDETHPLPPDPEGLELVSRVNCYRRLRYFDPLYTDQFDTDWIMSIDLDTLILQDITKLVASVLHGSDDLVILKSRWLRRPTDRPYNGALYLIRQGTNAHIWDTFDPVASPREIKRKKWVGSDQAWIGMQAPGARTLGIQDGIYFYGKYCEVFNQHKRLPTSIVKPEPAIINFAGRQKPWSKQVRFQSRHIYDEYHKYTFANENDSQSGNGSPK